LPILLRRFADTGIRPPRKDGRSRSQDDARRRQSGGGKIKADSPGNDRRVNSDTGFVRQSQLAPELSNASLVKFPIDIIL
jgi:hypothetical protein